MHIRHRLVTLGVGLALVGSACGGSALDVAADPSGAVVQAFQNMDDWDGAAFTLRLDSDLDSLIAMDDGAGDMTPELARALLSSFVELRGTAGEDPEDTADDQFQMRVHVDDLDAFELRTLGSDLYVRAAVRDLVERYDTTGTGMADLEKGIAQVRSFGMDFADTAVDGGWLKIEGGEQLASMMMGMAGTPTPDPSEAEALAAEATAVFERFVEEDVSVTYVGAEDAGEHVRLTANGSALLDLAEEMLDVLGPFGGAAFGAAADPSVMMGQLRLEAGTDADRFTLPFEVWIRGDTVSRVGFDVVAMYEANRALFEEDGDHMPDGVERFAVLVDVEPFGGGVDAPGDATVVDVFSIFGRLMNSMGQAFETAPA